MGTDDPKLSTNKDSTLATLSKSADTTKSAPKSKTTTPAKNTNLQKEEGIGNKQRKSTNAGIGQGQEKTTFADSERSDNLNDIENDDINENEAQTQEDEDQFVKVSFIFLFTNLSIYPSILINLLTSNNQFIYLSTILSIN